MKVAIDANIFISYLLGPGSLAPPSTVVRAAIAGMFEIVLPEEVVIELREKVASKPDLRGRIEQAQVDELATLLEEVATIIRPTEEVPLHDVRDAGDEFLLKSAILEQVEVIVSGDRDVLAMARTVAPVWITRPADFVRMLGIDA